MNLICFIKNNNVKQVWISQSIINNKDLFNNVKINYNNNQDLTLFCGMYNHKDYKKLLNHQGKKMIFWGGSDICHLNKNAKLKNFFKDNNVDKHVCLSESIYNNIILHFEEKKVINLNISIDPYFSYEFYKKKYLKNLNLYLDDSYDKLEAYHRWKINGIFNFQICNKNDEDNDNLGTIQSNNMAVMLLTTSNEFINNKLNRFFYIFYKEKPSQYKFDLFIFIDNLKNIDYSDFDKFKNNNYINTFKVINLNISDKDNINYDWKYDYKILDYEPELGHSSGPAILFFESYKYMSSNHSEYKNLLLLEWDTFFIKEYGYDKLNRIFSNKDFIISGSMYGSKKYLQERYHINGVAIYKNNNIDIINSENYIKNLIKKSKKKRINYDCGIYFYLKKINKNSQKYYNNNNRIINLSNPLDYSNLNLKNIKNINDDIILVHNKLYSNNLYMKNIEYIGGSAFNNIGDKMLVSRFKNIFKNCNITTRDYSWPITEERYERIKKSYLNDVKMNDKEKNEKINNLKKRIICYENTNIDVYALVGGTSPPIWLHWISDLLDKGEEVICFGTSICNSFTYENDKGKKITVKLEDYNNISYIINNINNKAKFIGIRDKMTEDIFKRYCNKFNGIIIGDPVINHNRFQLETNSLFSKKYKKIDYYNSIYIINNTVGISFGSQWLSNLNLEKKYQFYTYILNILDSKFKTIKVFLFNKEDISYFNSKEYNIKNKNKLKFIPNNNFSNYNLIDYEDCDLFIGERLHSIILSTSLGIPTLSLSYHEKCKSWMETLELDDYILDYNNINLDNLNKIFEDKFNLIFNNLDSIHKKIIGNIRYYLEIQNDARDKITEFNFNQIIKTDKLSDRIPNNYVYASKYIISHYSTKPFIKNIGYPTYMKDLIKTKINHSKLQYTLKTKHRDNLSSYVIKLTEGYSVMGFREGGYAGYNMLIDENGNMLSNYLNSFGPCCWNDSHLLWGKIYLRKWNKNKITYFNKKVVVLLSNKNYGHWFHDIIASIHLIEKENIGDHLIYLQTYNKCDYIMDSLYHLGYTDKDIIQANDYPIIKAKEIYLPVQQPRQVSWMKEWIHMKFANIVPIQNQDRKLYIGRGNAGHRKIINEKEIFNTLLKSRGFEYIDDISNLTLKETIKLFKQCKFIIMSHGANCMNVHWCNKNTNIIYLTNEKLNYYHGYFKECYTNDRINFYEFFCDYIDDESLPYKDKLDMIINIENFKKYLIQFD